MSLTVRALAANDTMPFIKAQWEFYKDDPNWVAPLIMDRKKLLDQKKNPFYKHSEMQLFLAERDGKVVGRIAAIVNYNHNKVHHDTVGFFGFFECVNDQDVANELFRHAETWLRDRGRTAVRGPVNPSMNDECGLLVEGDGPPVLLMTYNPPYYAELIERAGYGKVQDLVAYLLDQRTYRSEKLDRVVDALIKRNKITFRSIDFKNKQQFKRDVDVIKDIYNTAWEPNWGFVKMTDEEFDFLAADLKQIADPEYVFFAEVDGKIAGFILALPDINQCLKHNRSGNIVTGLWHLLTKKKNITLLRIVVLGVLPEYQKLGIDAALYHEVGRRSAPRGITHGEASWILEDNVMMNRAATQTMKGELYRRYRIYQKNL